MAFHGLERTAQTAPSSQMLIEGVVSAELRVPLLL